MIGRLFRAVLAGLVAGTLAGAFGTAGWADAHSGLIDTSPPASAVLDESPQEIMLTFASPVETRLASVQVFDANAAPVRSGGVSRWAGDSRSIVADVPPLPTGTYVVAWRVVSVDGHPSDGVFTFQVGADPPDGPVDVNDLLARVMAGSGGDPAVGWLAGLARWAGLMGLLLLVGGLAVVSFAHPPGGATPGTRRILWLGWSWMLVGSLGTLVLAGPYLTRRSLADTLDPGLWSEVLGTRTGRAIELRWGLLVGMAYVVTTAGRAGARWWRCAALGAAVGLAVTFSLAGHPAAGGGLGAVLGVALDAVHLLAASVWIGGLVTVVVLGAATADVARYSRWAAVAVPVVVVTGVAQAIRLWDGPGGLTDTTWGRVLLVKVAAVAVLVTVAAVARWLLRNDGSSSIRRLMAVEIALGLVVVALAAVLVAQPPAGRSSASPHSVTVSPVEPVGDGVLLDLTVTPARAGLNEVHLMFLPPGGALQQVGSVSATIVATPGAAPPVEIDLAFAGPNHWSGVARLPTSGTWELRVQAQGPDGVVRQYVTSFAVEA